MKYDMDELLQKAFSQKERPAKEFCQSVICKMEERETKRFFGKAGWLTNKWTIAAACLTMCLLAGVGIWNGRIETAPKQSQPMGQFAAAGGTQAPSASSSGRKADRKDSANASAPQDHLPRDGQDIIPVVPDSQTRPSDTSFGKKPEKRPEKAGEIEKTSERKTPSPGNVHPVSPAPGLDLVSPVPPTPLPAETTPPLPGVTSQPEDYVSLCSIDICRFGDRDISGVASPDNTENLEGVDMWDGLFQNRLIETYEQLQELIQTAKRTGKGQPSNTALWDMIGTLERYNRDFFLSEALCISILRLDQEYDLKLSSVSARENNEGHMKLYIEVEKVLSNDRGEPSERQTYSGCFVHVPREIAQKCSCVEVKIKKE